MFLNGLAIVAVVVLTAAIFAHSPPTPEKVLGNTPSQPDSGLVVSDLFPRRMAALTSSDIAVIIDSDIFSPRRAGGDAPPTAAKSSSRGTAARFELAGICVMGGVKGAFIISSKGKKGKRQFYSVGSRIGGSDYKLLEVSPEDGAVVLGSGASRLTLTLDRNDSASKKRRKVERKVISLQGTPPPESLKRGRGRAGSAKVAGPATSEELKAKRLRILERLKRNKR